MPDDEAMKDLANSYNGKKKDPYDQFSMTYLRSDLKYHYYYSEDGQTTGLVKEDKRTGKRSYHYNP